MWFDNNNVCSFWAQIVVSADELIDGIGLY